jgi:hypothetical protein
MAKKVYTLVKYEVNDGCDALNVLMATTDKQKALKKFQKEVAADKKVNPFWKNCKDRNLFTDIEGYYLVYDTEGCRMMNQTLIVIQTTNLVEKKKEKIHTDEGKLCPFCQESVLGPDGECPYCGWSRRAENNNKVKDL